MGSAAAAKPAAPDRRVRSLAKTMRRRMTRQEYACIPAFSAACP